MSVTVEIQNAEKLRRLRNVLGVKNDSEAIDIAVDRTLEVYEPENRNRAKHKSLDEHWDELFSQPLIPSEVIDQALRKEREDRF